MKPGHEGFLLYISGTPGAVTPVNRLLSTRLRTLGRAFRPVRNVESYIAAGYGRQDDLSAIAEMVGGGA